MSTAAQRARRKLDRFVLAVCLAGAGMAVTLVLSALTFAPVHLTRAMLVLSLALVLGELRPVKVARGEQGDDEITISSTFAMALVITGPLAVAVAAQTGAVLFDDLRRGKPMKRVAFNVAQYTLTLVAARAVYALVAARPYFGTGGTMTPRNIIAALAGALAFFVVNHGVVGTAVAMDLGAR